MESQSPYQAIADDAGDQRWAFGTGFADPLAGVDQAVPGGAAPADLAAYCLMLGDDALIMSHRLQQWLARAPELEEETALANIALDLLGQARLLLTRAGRADGTGRTEDDYAFGRPEAEFRNVHLTETGATERYGAPMSAEVAERLEYELTVIENMGFAAYFLVVEDLIRFARENTIYYNIRGSVAGSLVVGRFIAPAPRQAPVRRQRGLRRC